MEWVAHRKILLEEISRVTAAIMTTQTHQTQMPSFICFMVLIHFDILYSNISSLLTCSTEEGKKYPNIGICELK